MNTLIGLSRNLNFLFNAVPKYSYYIHFEDSGRKINRPKEPLSFQNPKGVRKEQPQRFLVPDSRKIQRAIAEKKFKMFRDKMIASAKPTYVAEIPQSLWGVPEQERPKHYYQLMSNTELFTIPRAEEASPKFLSSTLQYNQALVKNVDFSNLKQYTPVHLLNIALWMRQTSHFQRKHWFQLEKLLEKRLPYLNTDELVKLKWSLSGPPKFGTVTTHHKLNDLIIGDLDTMDLPQLIAAFCCFSNEKNHHWQAKIISKITETPKFLNKINGSAEEVISTMTAYAQYRIPIYRKKIEERDYNESRVTAQSFVNLLALEKYANEFSADQVLQLLKNLHSLKIEGYQHILLLINHRLENGLISEFRPEQIPDLIFLLSKVENGTGFIKYATFDKLKESLLANWDSYSDYKKVKSLYCFWNIERWTQDLIDLYIQIPVSIDINSLYYFSQIELLNSTGKEAEVTRAIAQVDYIPLPYYYKIKQFYLHIQKLHKEDWDLKPVYDKLSQTEYHFDCSRSKNNYLNDYRFTELGKFLAMNQFEHRMQPLVQVENIELVQFAFEYLRISVEYIHEREMLPEGVKGVKKTYQARLQTLRNCGWHPIAVNWSSFCNYDLPSRYGWIKQALTAATELQIQLLAEQEPEAREDIYRIAVQRTFSLYAPEDYENFATAKELQQYRWDYEPPAEEQPAEEAGEQIEEAAAENPEEPTEQ